MKRALHIWLGDRRHESGDQALNECGEHSGLIDGQRELFRLRSYQSMAGESGELPEGPGLCSRLVEDTWKSQKQKESTCASGGPTFLIGNDRITIPQRIIYTIYNFLDAQSRNSFAAVSPSVRAACISPPIQFRHVAALAARMQNIPPATFLSNYETGSTFLRDMSNRSSIPSRDRGVSSASSTGRQTSGDSTYFAPMAISTTTTTSASSLAVPSYGSIQTTQPVELEHQRGSGAPPENALTLADLIQIWGTYLHVTISVTMFSCLVVALYFTLFRKKRDDHAHTFLMVEGAMVFMSVVAIIVMMYSAMYCISISHDDIINRNLADRTHQQLREEESRGRGRGAEQV